MTNPTICTPCRPRVRAMLPAPLMADAGTAPRSRTSPSTRTICLYWLILTSCAAFFVFEAMRFRSAMSTGADESPGSSVDSKGSELLASSDASAQLGLDRWEFEGGSIYGLARDGEVLAEFHVQPDNLAIESILPEAGIRHTDGSADFPAVTGRYYDAMTLDMQSLSESTDLASASIETEKAVVNCFLILDNCLTEAVQRQVLFGQSCSCSFNVAACSVFLPLALDCI